MNRNLFEDLREALQDAAQFARGEKLDLRTVQRFPPPAPMSATAIRRLRRRMNVSQAVFAQALNISLDTVQSWEQGLRRPSRAALRLLRIVERDPRVLVGAESSRAGHATVHDR